MLIARTSGTFHALDAIMATLCLTPQYVSHVRKHAQLVLLLLIAQLVLLASISIRTTMFPPDSASHAQQPQNAKPAEEKAISVLLV